MKLLLALSLLCASSMAAFAQIDVSIGYLHQEEARPPTLSNLDTLPDNLGIIGAEVGLKDNATTGLFLGHNYSIEKAELSEEDDVVKAAKALLAKSKLLVLDASTAAILKIAALPEAKNAMLFNVSSGNADLRQNSCSANLFHTLPSDRMRTDALMQFFVKKRWSRLALIEGPNDRDVSYAAAIRASAKKFGLNISAEKKWAFDADMRRNASQEVPLFTQSFGDYDALILADEFNDFGRYVLYNTWVPRPIAGSEGLTAVTWSRVVEQWGAAQLQSRFTKKAKRAMLPKDYAAWAAVRSIGEAVTRTNSADVGKLRDYILSDKFELAGFKGRPLSFRKWNGQLRQPIPIVHPRALVALAPLEGFLHQTTELDTLGFDKPETLCKAF